MQRIGDQQPEEKPQKNTTKKGEKKAAKSREEKAGPCDIPPLDERVVFSYIVHRVFFWCTHAQQYKTTPTGIFGKKEIN